MRNIAVATTFALAFVLIPRARSEPASDGWVVLPLEEYRTLRNRAFPPPKDREAPPVPAAVSRVDYELAVSGENAVGRAIVTVDVFEDGWVRVPIPSGLRVRDARVDGRAVPLVDTAPEKGDARRELILARPGRSLVTLEVALPLAVQGATHTLTLPPSPFAVSRINLVVAQPGVSVTVTGGLLTESSPAGPQPRFVAYGRPGESLTLAWGRRRDDPRASLPLRLRGSVTEMVGLGEDAAQVTAEIQLDVIQGAAEKIQVALPESFVVNEVSGPLVADWDARGDVLSISFLSPVDAPTRLVITGECRVPRAGAVRIPLLRLPAAERETGGVAVEVLGAGEIEASDASGLDPADPSDLGPLVAEKDSPALTALRFRALEGRAARALTVTVARFTPQATLLANVEEARFRALLTEDGKTLLQARYAVRNNRRSFLGLTLPPGATLWSAAVAGRRVRPGLAPDGTLLLPLAGAPAGDAAPAFAVEVVALLRNEAWSDKGQARLPLPSVDVPISRTGLVVHHSPRYALALLPGTFRPAPFAPPASPALQGFAVPALRRPAPEQKAMANEVQGLVERYQKEARAGGKAGILPIDVPFPAVGPSLFLAAELTEAGQAPAAGLGYTRKERR